MKLPFKPFAVIARLLLAAALLLAVIPLPASVALARAGCAATHTVSGPETIWRLAKQYGVPAMRIAKANNIKPPYTLTSSQQICIPAKTAGSLNTGVSISAALSKDSLTISGTGFPKLRAYNVKISSGSAWYKLTDILMTDKNGAIKEVRYTLPAELKGKAELTVCLKDTQTDALGCFKAGGAQ